MHTPDSTNLDKLAKNDPQLSSVCDPCIHRTLCLLRKCEACVYFALVHGQPFYEEEQNCVMHRDRKCRFLCFKQLIKHRMTLVRMSS